jgi:hypothetical protein
VFEMSVERDPDQLEPEVVAAISTETDESAPDKQEPYVDQEMADAYGFTPQQAKEMSLYL